MGFFYNKLNLYMGFFYNKPLYGILLQQNIPLNNDSVIDEKKKLGL